MTNGLGAGLDAERPVRHGILEILQRHTNGLRFRALDARSPEIDPAGLDADGEVAALAARFAAEGVEAVFKHAATAFGVCSTYVMGVDADDSSPVRLTACGEAADPSVGPEPAQGAARARELAGPQGLLLRRPGGGPRRRRPRLLGGGRARRVGRRAAGRRGHAGLARPRRRTGCAR